VDRGLKCVLEHLGVVKAQEVWSTWTSAPRISRAVYAHSFTLVSVCTSVYDGNDATFTDTR